MNENQVGARRTRGRPRSNSAAVANAMKTNGGKNLSSSQNDWFVVDKSTEADPCDCPFPGCEGCWYPCEKCGSTKCSPFCRLRKETTWQQKFIEWKRTEP